MLRITMVKLSAKNLRLIGKNNTIDRVGGNSKVDKTKFQSNFSVKLAKFKNMVRPYFLAKSKFLARPSSKTDFLISKARLVFAKSK